MPLLDLFWAMLWFFAFVVWIWLLFAIFGDIFRTEMSGWAKAGWTTLVFVLPFIGVLTYLIVHGSGMQERSAQQALAIERAQRDYIRKVAGTSASTADELSKLASLYDAGALTEQEYQSQKARLLVA